MEFQTGYYSRNYALPLPPFLESVDAPELQNGPICPPKFQVRLPGSPPVSPTEDIPFVRVEEGERTPQCQTSHSIWISESSKARRASRFQDTGAQIRIL